MTRRLLLVVPQLPQDPASGAARTALAACRMAAEAGWQVRAIGTTASEGAQGLDVAAYLRQLGHTVTLRSAGGARGRELVFDDGLIPTTLLHTGQLPARAWPDSLGRRFDALFDAELAAFRPDVILTYGARPDDQRRHWRARQTGCRIAFCVFNQGYKDPGASFDAVDAVLTPSQWLADDYRAAIGLVSTPLPTPIEEDEVIAADREPIFVTMVNPSVEKGLFFVARLAEAIGAGHPDIAMLIVEARGTAGMLTQAGLRGGFDLRRHGNLMFSPVVPRPRDIFQPTRILVVPSVGPESSGRVVAEALTNGIPPLVSDRGGLAESCNGAGFVLPLPAALTLETSVPVGPEAVAPWVAVIARLCKDEAFYAGESAKALAASAIYHRATLAPRYVAFFESLLTPVRPAAPNQPPTP